MLYKLKIYFCVCKLFILKILVGHLNRCNAGITLVEIRMEMWAI